MKNKVLKGASRLFALSMIMALLILCALPGFAFADSPTDEILNYEITADVNDDATVNLQYHIEWKVLESDTLGPLSWVSIGLPNTRVMDCYPLSDTVTSLEQNGNYMNVYLDKDYYEGEVASFDFMVVQDYMYEMNGMEEGYTSYYFTPGWFDGIDVDTITIRWNNEKLDTWEGDVQCLIKDGYNTWTGTMPAGDTFSVLVTYPNDAFGFDSEKSMYSADDDYYGGNDGGDYYDDDDWPDFVYVIIGAIVFFAPQILLVGFVARRIYRISKGFSADGSTRKVVTRTKITYYSTCPGCGASRVEGKDTCEYCGHTMIEKEEVLKEETVKERDKPAMDFNRKGTYHYSDSPNTYVRVNVVHVPVPGRSHSSSSSSSSSSRGSSGRSHGGGHSGGSRGSHSSCAHSSCAHSSCACACASCACACACACASGGRAGCTYKDFYKTGLKLKQLMLKKNRKAE